jgi:hypothetical protein
MSTNENSPGANPGAISPEPTTSTHHGTNGCVDSTHGADVLVDLELVGGVNADLWALLFDGKFRLAVKCDTCGRWLTAGASKAAGRGPHCAARAVNR